MSFIETPPVPYSAPLYGGHVTDGMLISITGVPDSDVQWFAINLQCGPNTDPRDDIALHLSPRFEGPNSRVIRNSLHGGQWGQEESDGSFPFSPGRPFEILINADDDSYNIAIDGEHYCELAYRMPMENVNTLVIDGGVQIISIRTEGGQVGVLPTELYDEPERQEIMGMQASANFGADEEMCTKQSVGGSEGWFSKNKSPQKPPPEVGAKDKHGTPNWVKYAAGGVAAAGAAAVGAYALKKLVYPKKGSKAAKGKPHDIKGAMGAELSDRFLSGNRGGTVGQN